MAKLPKTRVALYAFNRGIVSRKALGRVDIERLRLSAETQKNYMPTVLGPMMIRPGTEYVMATRSSAVMKPVPFVFSNDDMAMLQLTASIMRVMIDDELVTYASVSTTVTNGDFSSGTGWTLANSAGGSSSIAAGKLNLAGVAIGGSATCTRSVTVIAADQNVAHSLRITVDRGPILFRVGSTSGADDYITSTLLDTGTHALELTPTGDFYVQFENREIPNKIVDSITIGAAGVLELATPWTEANLPNIRYFQSADVIFVACIGVQQRRIERRATHSWSIVLYKSNAGPFLTTTDDSIEITPSATIGNITLTASRDLFRLGHVGALFRLFQDGQTVTASFGAENLFSSAIRVTGVGTARSFTIDIAGTFVATVTLQRSFTSESTGFADVTSYTTVGTVALSDGFDNSICWYRIGVKTGNYTSGTVNIALRYPGGGGSGIARVTGYTSRTVVDAEVLDEFSGTVATDNWIEGAWSDYRGYPSAVTLHEGRLWWAAGDHMWGSESDDYTGFDYEATGDAAPIDRTIGYGPVYFVNWFLPLSRLIVGRQGSEISVRSSSFDEPLTPTNFHMKDCSTQGSANLPAIKLDTSGVFVQQSGRAVFALAYNVQIQDYGSKDLTRLCPDLFTSDVVALGVQRQPQTVIHFATEGNAFLLVYDTDDEVTAWWEFETDGVIEDVCVFPGAPEDTVYYVVNRTIDGSTVRYIEKMARTDQCNGMPEARIADSHYMYSGALTTTITGLDHLEGEEVIVWGWNTTTPFTVTLPDGSTQEVGKDFGTFTVASGEISGLSDQVTDACVGLSYDAEFKSAKLAYAAAGGTALTKKKKIDALGLVMADPHMSGIQYGQSFDVMDDLPLVEQGDETDTAAIWEEFDAPMMAVPGEWDTDARLCLKSQAPKPCTVLACAIAIQTNE